MIIDTVRAFFIASLADGSLYRAALAFVAAVALGISFRTALRASEKLALAKFKRKPGAPSQDPVKEAAARANSLDKQAARFSDLLLKIGLFGFAVPSLCFLCVLIFPQLVDPSPSVYLSADSAVAQPHPSLAEVLVFFGNQLVRGVTADMLDIFKLRMGSLVNDPAALPFGLAILVFRLGLQGIEVIIISSFFRLGGSYLWRRAGPKKKLKKAVHAHLLSA
jgi:hypothetical protein